MNNNLTTIQKKMMIDLALRYDERVLNILRRGDDCSFIITTDQEAAIIESFAEDICSRVIRDYPDYNGDDFEINKDAELATFIVSKVLHQYSSSRHENE